MRITDLAASEAVVTDVDCDVRLQVIGVKKEKVRAEQVGIARAKGMEVHHMESGELGFFNVTPLNSRGDTGL